MADDTTSFDAAEAARAQAEARRRRILEKAEKRMGVVSGEQVMDETEKKVSASKAARIRAARARRYGKKTATPPTESKVPVADDAPKADEAATEEAKKAEPKAEKEKDATSKNTEELSEAKAETETTQLAKEMNPEVETTKEEPSVIADDATQPTTGTSSAAPKKKYMGVAKMRRQMIMKKKLSKAEETKANPTSVEKHVAVKPAQKGATLPIYMHIVTILLLLFAGMDVGFQLHHEEVLVHTSLAIREEGIPFLHRNIWNNQAEKGADIDILQAESIMGISDAVAEDEFQEADEEQYIPTIDPLFGVDLDEMTSGPGLLNQLARGAVAMHRMFIFAVYHTPVNMFQAIIGIPRALLQTPPALCLVALLLRQVVGKMILKAGIPILDGEEKDSAIDVLAMVKNGVSNFLSSSFPTAVGLYDGFVHLRSDMYIVICGVFCGMAWVHMPTGSLSPPLGNGEL